MVRETPNTIQSEANEAHPHPEAADHHIIDVRQDEWQKPLGPCATCGPPSCRCGEATDTSRSTPNCRRHRVVLGPLIPIQARTRFVRGRQGRGALKRGDV